MAILKGVCSAQGEEFSISIQEIPCETLEDDKPKFKYGTICCDYIKFGGKCDSKNCSILKEHGIKR